MKENKIEDFKLKHELHQIVTSYATQEENLNAYNKWASSYEGDLLQEGVPLWDVVSIKMLGLIKRYHKPGDMPVIIDAGCGTGAPASMIRKLAEKESLPIRLIGYDISEGMLEEARKKHVFDELHVGDFFGELPVSKESADYVLCSGVFLEGHCKPEALVPVLGHLRQGGMGLISIRINSFEYRKDEYYKFIEQEGCVVSESFVDQYYPPIKAMYLVVRKQ
ncbi:methyltransferase [Gracilaria domingensis]|nr:methyltransferase [Gracilaria domingensis]